MPKGRDFRHYLFEMNWVISANQTKMFAGFSMILKKQRRIPVLGNLGTDGQSRADVV